MADANYLVTGSWGEPHVTSAQQRNFNSGILGGGQYVMQGMGLTVQDANTVKLDAGFGIMNGADVEVPPEGAVLKLDNGTQAQNRNDLVVLRYERDESEPQNVRESVTPVVIKGTPSDGDAEDPAHSEGSILDGDSPVDMPLWRVPISGLTPGEPVKLFEEIDAYTGIVPIRRGGTGATTADAARKALKATGLFGDAADAMVGCDSQYGQDVFVRVSGPNGGRALFAKDDGLTYYNLDGQGEVYKLKAPNKLLWEGSLGANATITVPGISEYQAVLVRFAGTNRSVIVSRGKQGTGGRYGYTGGSMTAAPSDGKAVLYAANFDVDLSNDKVMTLTNGFNGYVQLTYASLTVEAWVKENIVSITGIV